MHCSLGKYYNGRKIIQLILMLLQQRPHPELRNELPIDSLELPYPNRFMASPSPDLIQRLAIKGFEDAQDLQTLKWGLVSKFWMRALSYQP